LKKHRILKDTFLVIILVGLGKVLGFLKEMLIAKQFGATFESDVFFFAFGMTSILFSAVGTSMGTSFMPIYSEIKIKDDKKTALKFLNKNVNIILILSIVLSMICIVFAKQLIMIFAPGFIKFGSDRINFAIEVTRIMMISIIFLGIQSIIAFALNAEKEYKTPSFSSLMFNIVCISYLLVFSSKYGIKGLVWSVVFAFLIQALVQMPKIIKHGYRFRVDFNFKDSYIKRMFILMGPVIVGSSVNQINLTIDKIIVSLLGEGAISNLNYSNKLIMLVYGIVSIVISNVLFNEMVEAVNKNELVKLKKILVNTLIFCIIFILPISFIMIIFRTEIVRVLFEGGAFTAEDTQNTAKVFFMLIPTMMLFILRDLLSRVFYSLKDTKTSMKNGIMVTIINVILSVILSRYMGVVGVALATTLSTLFSVIALTIRLNSKIDISFGKAPFIFISSLISCLLTSYIIEKIFRLYIQTSDKLKLFILICIASVLFFVIFFIIVAIINFKFIIKNKRLNKKN